MSARRVFIFAALATLAAAAPVLAHHGWGSYDAANPVTVTGAMTHVTYEYPHVHVMADQDGKSWEIILAPPSRMEARQAVMAVVRPGKAISAYGYASRQRPGEMRAERITIDGKTYEMR